MTMTVFTTFQPIDVDNIYEATHSPWFFISPTKKTGVYRSEIEVIDLEDNETFIVDADSLYRATIEVMEGKHTGNYIASQCVNDFNDWKDNPKYGVPFDSELSDIILQVAALGELVYG